MCQQRPFYNPALLAASHPKDRFAIELPVFGARIYDPENFAEAIDDFQESDVVEQLDQAIAAFNNNSSNGTSTIRSSMQRLDNELYTLGDSPLQAEIGAGVVVGAPSREHGLAFTANTFIAMGGTIHYEDSPTFQKLEGDLATLDSCATTPGNYDVNCIQSAQFAFIDTSNPNAPTITFEAGGDNSDVNSSVDIRGLVISEVGITYAREVTIKGHKIGLGVTPKYVRTAVFDYTANVETSDTGDINSDDYLREYSNFNLDLGVAMDYSNGWRTGLVVKGLVPQSYATYRRNSTTGAMEPTGHSVDLAPQMRLGVSKQDELYTLAADLDLTMNNASGFEGDSRYLALGAEFDVWSWAQLRTGYRANLAESARNVWSFGIGLSPYGAHMDLGVAGNANELGAAIQFGYRH